MRISKSASTLAKRNYLKDKPHLEVARTNTFSEDDFKNIENKSIPDLVEEQKTKKIVSKKRTKSAIVYGLDPQNGLVIKATGLSSKDTVQRFINKKLPKVSINNSFQTKPTENKMQNGPQLNADTENNQISDVLKSFNMRKSENSNFHLQPIDPELRAYVHQKKNIRDKIHDHWKLELNAQSLQRGASFSMINRNMFKPEQQWIDIKIATNDLNDSSNNKMSLIDTFTSNLDKPKNNADMYKVSGDVGSLIAQKLVDGEKMRVGRNGELINKPTDSLNNDVDKSNLSHLFSDGAIPRYSILSWNDQVKKENIRILEPSVNETRVEIPKTKPERNLIVKKLVDEEEYKPKLKKSPLESKEYKNYNSLTPRRVTPTLSFKNQDRLNNKTPVEIVGFSRKNTNMEQQNNQSALKEDNFSKFSDPDEIFSVSLVPAKPTKTNGKLYENLNDKNYDEIFENLTNRYTDPDSKKKIKQVNLDKRRSAPLNVDLKQNFNFKDDKSLLKSLEKKYKNLIYHDDNNSSISSTSKSPQNQMHLDPNSPIFKNLSLFQNYKTTSTSSATSTPKQQFNSLDLNKNSELNENVSLKINSLADGLYEFNTGNKKLTSLKNPHPNLSIFKPLNTVINKTNKNNTKIYSNI